MSNLTIKKLASTLLLGCLGILSSFAEDELRHPNIVLIYADDMGYGDVQILNPERSKIPTPHMDALARDGMIFTDAHTSSSVCTPSRYGLLTGRYNWRTKLQYLVTWGYSPPLIADDTLTLGKLLQQQGYNTAMIGKWHLGMNMPTTDGKPLRDSRSMKTTNIDWDAEIKDGPTDRGFDYLFGISASLDMAPYTYIENDHFVAPVDNSKPSAPAEGFKKIEVLGEFASRSAKFIKEQKGEKPFFLYVPLTSPHTPILPTPEWTGKSGINKYADFQMQTDDAIGQIIRAVDEAGLAENTLIIVSSDNGCSKAANFKQLEDAGHYASAQFRGSKADLWEGGHRVPFIVRWPAMVKAGSISDQTICLTDVLATFADITKFDLQADQGVDSVSFLPALKGNEIVSTRKGIVNHSISGHFAYRQGKWKLLLAEGSGGWTAPTEKNMAQIEDAPRGQLYDLEADPGEQNNLYQTNPEVVEQLMAQLKEDIANGRSTAGSKQENDIPVDQIELWKGNVTR
ncbi:MAG: arylsulfatase [Akkermansiaceae bacterium]|jgi:arylsulfatase A|nr:arylsulfatase [Akkermansiaceae bacterium]MDP4646040.1 arylsulfatase [Akkermansiaceae bacterium]MDP4721981.1 arylsulfatase [Akkermansiaceae bacterium]MDP4780802.1 arylsulfatase [Akkermansiaceae bacterium]MDP4847863.1 arylsulfatase [Akkermansiaceae bacterium]